MGLSKPFESLTARPVRLGTEAEALLYPQPATMTMTVGRGRPNSNTMREAEWPLQACPAGDARSLCTGATSERHAEGGDIGGPLLVETSGGECAQLGALYYRDYEPSPGGQRYVPAAPYWEWIAETVGKPDHLAVTLGNNVPGTCTVNLGDVFPVLLLAAETRTFETPVGETFWLSAAGSDGTGTPPVGPIGPPPFRPQGVEIALGTSGETALPTTEARDYTLNGKAFTSGTTVTASNGDVYRLVLDGTTWTAVKVDP